MSTSNSAQDSASYSDGGGTGLDAGQVANGYYGQSNTGLHSLVIAIASFGHSGTGGGLSAFSARN